MEEWLLKLAEEIAERLEKDREENARFAKKLTVSIASLNPHGEGQEPSVSKSCNLRYGKQHVFEDSFGIVRSWCHGRDFAISSLYLGGHTFEKVASKDISQFMQPQSTSLAEQPEQQQPERSPKRQRSSSAAAAQSQISFGAPAPVPALSAAAAAGAAAAGEAAAAAAAAPPSPLTIDRCDLDTRLFLQSAAGAEVQQDTFFGLPKELRTAIVRDWKREHAQRQRQGGRGGSSSSSAPKSTPKDNKSLKSFFKSK